MNFSTNTSSLFDVPPHFRTDNDVSGLAPIYIPAAVDNYVVGALSPRVLFIDV